jgi:hypothetical protein
MLKDVGIKKGWVPEEEVKCFGCEVCQGFSQPYSGLRYLKPHVDEPGDGGWECKFCPECGRKLYPTK